MYTVDIVSPCGGGKSGIEKVLKSWKKIKNINIRFVHLGRGIAYLDGYREAYEFDVYDSNKDMVSQTSKMAETYSKFVLKYGPPNLSIALNYPIMSKIIRVSQKLLTKENKDEFKIVSFVHNDVNMYEKVGLGGLIELAEADYHLCINKTLIKQLKEVEINENKIFNIGNPIEFPEEKIFLKRNYENGKIRKKQNKLIFVGRVSAEKRLDIILEAMYRAKSNWKLKIIGDGEYKKELFDIVEYLGLRNNIEYLGWKDEPWDYLEDEVALVSASDYEGFLLVGAEALANGIMVLTTRTVIDYIKEGVNGYFFDNTDGIQLAQLLDRIANGEIKIPDPKLCRDSVLEYEEENYLKKVKDILMRMIDKTANISADDYFKLISDLIEYKKTEELDRALFEALVKYPYDYRWYFIKRLLAEAEEDYEEQLLWILLIKFLKEDKKIKLTKKDEDDVENTYIDLRNNRVLRKTNIRKKTIKLLKKMIDCKAYELSEMYVSFFLKSECLEIELGKVFMDRELVTMSMMLEIGLTEINNGCVILSNREESIEKYNSIIRYKDNTKKFFEVLKKVRFCIERICYGIKEIRKRTLVDVIVENDITPEMLLVFIRGTVPLDCNNYSVYKRILNYLENERVRGKTISEKFIKRYEMFLPILKEMEQGKKETLFQEVKEEFVFKKTILNLDVSKRSEIIEYEKSKIEKGDKECEILNCAIKEWDEIKRIITDGSKNVDNKKIAIIFCTNDNEMRLECETYLRTLKVPDDYSLEVIEVVNAKSMTSGYNAAIINTDAKYKLYIHHDVWIIEPNVLLELIQTVQKFDDLKLVGVVGSGNLYIGGGWFEGENLEKNFVKICQNYEIETHLTEYIGKDVDCVGTLNDKIKLYRAKAIDGVFMFTTIDVPWREDIFTNWHFYDISECVEYVKRGYECAFFDNGKINIHHYVTVNGEAAVEYLEWKDIFLNYVKEIDEKLFD